KEIYNIVREANQAGIDAVEANVPLKKFDLKARKIIDDSGYGDYFNNRIGHGLGIEVHEAPSIHEKMNKLLNLDYSLQLSQVFISLDMVEYVLKMRYI